jgi:tight adherence protein B
MSQLPVISGLIFVAAIIAVESIYWLLFELRGVKKTINRRLSLSEKSKGRRQSEVFETLRSERGFSDFRSPTLTRVNDFIVQTGLRTSKFALAASTIMIVVVVAFLLVELSLPLWMAAGIGAVAAPALVYLYLWRTRQRRMQRFALQLPDALDIIVRGLRVGHPFSSAIELVSREMPDPIGSEFGMTADEMTFGQDVNTAVANLHRRVGQEDLLFLGIAVGVQNQTGGNLAEVLARLSSLMRERVTMALKVKALSAEGRLSGWFLSVMPFILYGAIQLMSKSYFSELRGSPALVPALVYGWTSLIIANITIYRMVNFKV